MALRAVADGRPPWQTLLVYLMLHPTVPELGEELAEAVAAVPAALQLPTWMIAATRRTTLGDDVETT